MHLNGDSIVSLFGYLRVLYSLFLVFRNLSPSLLMTSSMSSVSRLKTIEVTDNGRKRFSKHDKNLLGICDHACDLFSNQVIVQTSFVISCITVDICGLRMNHKYFKKKIADFVFSCLYGCASFHGTNPWFHGTDEDYNFIIKFYSEKIDFKYFSSILELCQSQTCQNRIIDKIQLLQ